MGKNPLFTDQYTADPAPLVDNCTFYIACGHDQGTTGFVLKEWFVLKSTDMVNWTKTVVMNLSTFSWATANAWAGQIIAKNGKYYWYVPVADKNNAMAIGVAVADSPMGPYKDAIGKPLIDDAFEMAQFGYTMASQTVYTIDPTVFVDDDAQATPYLHYGGFGRMVEAKLGQDMISISGKLQETTPQGYFEAAYLTKQNGTYYEIYAAGQNPATIDYSTSTSPMGPWTYRGRVLDAMPAAPGQDPPTNHSGVAQFAGQWYIVYAISNGPNGGGTYRREVAVDKLTVNANGTIQKVVPSSGLKF
jgi:beta-xylosidase